MEIRRNLLLAETSASTSVGVGVGKTNSGSSRASAGMFCQSIILKPSRSRRIKKCCWLLAIICFGYVSLDYYLSYTYQFWNPQHPNYFVDAIDFKSMGFTVNTGTCKILNLSAYDKSIISLVGPSSSSPPTDCYKTYKHWTFVNGSNIIMNVTAMEESGYTMNAVECCYRIISRVEQTMEAYDKLADAVSKVSNVCEPLTKEINLLSAEFVRVKCTSKYWPAFRDIVYRNYHTLAQPNRSTETWAKINYWRKQNKAKEENFIVPPNVLILGIDSMSRLNFVRTMKQTRAYLQQIGAIELLGYAKVGENTYPNCVALLSGFSEEDIKKICYPTQYAAQDSCPYIWHGFNIANYLTGHLEDMPGLQMLNRLKTGFVKQQVDFYMRPFMLDLFGPIYEKDCIGPDTQDEKVFNYIKNIWSLSSEYNVPSFIFSWITNLAHRNLNSASYADGSYENFFRTLNLNNTILFFMSDHGFRYGSFRESFAGWFEDKLPNFWVYLPPSIRAKYPGWQHALEVNSKRLSSPFDFYHTLNHILQEFSSTPAKHEQNEKPDQIVVSTNGSSTIFSRKFGQSFFKEVPSSRKCSDAGIQNHFCPCATPRKLPLNDLNLIQAAEVAVDFINNMLPPQCSKLKVTKLTAGGIIENLDEDPNRTPNVQAVSYVVGLMTDPGSFLFEATVEYNNSTKLRNKFQVTGNVLRMNKMSNDVSCVHDAEIEKMCYCSS